MTPRRQWRPGQLARCRCAPPIDAEPVRVEHGGYVPTLVGGHECPTAVIVRRPTGPRPQGLEQITARIPVELADRARARGALSGVITESLTAFLGGSASDPPSPPRGRTPGTTRGSPPRRRRAARRAAASRGG